MLVTTATSASTIWLRPDDRPALLPESPRQVVPLEQPQRRQRTVLEIGQGNITRADSISAKEAVWADSGNSWPAHVRARYNAPDAVNCRRPLVPCRHQNRLQRTAGGAFAIRPATVNTNGAGFRTPRRAATCSRAQGRDR